MVIALPPIVDAVVGPVDHHCRPNPLRRSDDPTVNGVTPNPTTVTTAPARTCNPSQSTSHPACSLRALSLARRSPSVGPLALA